MGRLTAWLDRTFYPQVAGNWDDAALRAAVLSKAEPSTHLLDLGAGAGVVPQMNFKAHVARAAGVDPDPRVLTNPHLHDAKIGVGESIAYGDAEFDIVVADNVLEHLADPLAVFREVHRVLKPGGYFLAKTPNRHHYMPTIARLTPLSFHKFYNRLRGRNAEDTFPTLYRANSRSQIAALAQQSGFEVEAIDFIESRPEYLRMTALSYLAGIAYERVVNATDMLAGARVVLLMRLHKPDAPELRGKTQVAS